MCGISGIINKKNLSISESDIKRMTDIIAHRGPDGDGFYFGDNFAFGHRRLAIIDLSPLGAQPMHYMERYVITYNGEIYNYIELKEELTAFGYVFKTHTDTEVILAAYDKWREDCFKKFNGMWALAIYDKNDQTICLSRDRFGVKPLYYYINDNYFYFGSEIRQLIMWQDKHTPNLSRVVDFIVMGISDHTDQTFFSKIYKIKQSNYFLYNLRDNTYTQNEYYNLNEYNYDDIHINTAKKKVIDEFSRSIMYRLRSDVKIGTCLSGGIDSSLIAAVSAEMLAKQGDLKISAVTGKSFEAETDESDYAQQVVFRHSLRWHVIEPTIKMFNDIIENIILIQEEPFSGLSVGMQYFVMKYAADNNIKVLLDGQGGDEVFLGYDTSISYVIKNYLDNFEVNKAWQFFRKCKAFKISKTSLVRQLFYFYFPKLHYLRLKLLLKISAQYFSFQHFRHLYPSLKSLFQFQKDQIVRSVLPQLLRYEDKNSMWCSLETRLPFLDYKLVEYVTNLPLEMKVTNGFMKYLERLIASEHLPEEIAWRRVKYGFFAPSKSWFKKMRSKVMQEINNSILLKKINPTLQYDSFSDDVLWKYFILAKWEKAWGIIWDEKLDI